MNRLLAVLVLGLAGAVAAPASAHSLKELEAALGEREPSVEIVHQPVTPLALENLSGRRVPLSEYRSKVVVLYFTDPDCKDCAVQSRELSEIRQELSKTPMRDRVGFIAAKRPPAPQFADGGAVTYLIDKTGNLRARYRGAKFNATNMILHLNALANDVH